MKQVTLIYISNLLFLLSFTANAESLDTLASQCSEAMNQGNVTKALTLAESILNNNPKHQGGLLCKGRAQGANGQYDAALTTMQSALTESKTSFDQLVAHLLIGNLHKAHNEPAEAIASYQKSLSVSNSDNNQKFSRINHMLIAESYALQQDYQAALNSYIASSKLDNNDNERADSYAGLASAYGALGQHDSAIEYQLKSVVMQKKAGTLDQYAEACLGLGVAYEKAQDFQNAEKTYEKLRLFARENGGSYYEAKAGLALAMAQHAGGKPQDAQSTIKEALNTAKNAGDQPLSKEIESAMTKIKM